MKRLRRSQTQRDAMTRRRMLPGSSGGISGVVSAPPVQKQQPRTVRSDGLENPNPVAEDSLTVKDVVTPSDAQIYLDPTGDYPFVGLYDANGDSIQLQVNGATQFESLLLTTEPEYPDQYVQLSNNGGGGLESLRLQHSAAVTRYAELLATATQVELDGYVTAAIFWYLVASSITNSVNLHGEAGDTNHDFNLHADANDTALSLVSGPNSMFLQVDDTNDRAVITVSESASDAPAPGANKAALFARDNGSGKTQLCVRFNTGAVQILATEP